ncbi:metal-dependent hydrolase [candidate division KSB1 bacterium]|nr:metal-dependent hydrolase [candidate division KSB1 bacterium]RQW06306.1 MAG: metal-dependent hydrolase [candidate division KSB1 bacterium]
MPTPVGHIIAGAIIYQAQQKEKNIWFLTFLLFFAMLPDCDFIFGFLVGDPNRYHHQFTHSFVFVVSAGLFGGLIYSKWQRTNFTLSSAFFVCAGITHVILDLLAVDKREPFGCPIWWPFSNKFAISPVLIFSDVSRVSDSRLFFKSLFNAHNMRTITLELFILMPIALIILWITRIKQGNTEQ